MSKRPVILVSGPSGSGKNYLIDRLQERLPDRLRYVRTTTTRAPRDDPGQRRIDLETMRQVSIREFRRLIDERLLVEWDQPYTDTFYGTERDELAGIARGQAGIKAATEVFIPHARAEGHRVFHVEIEPRNWTPRDPARRAAELARPPSTLVPDLRFASDRRDPDGYRVSLASLADVILRLIAAP